MPSGTGGAARGERCPANKQPFQRWGAILSTALPVGVRGRDWGVRSCSARDRSVTLGGTLWGDGLCGQDQHVLFVAADLPFSGPRATAGRVVASTSGSSGEQEAGIAELVPP